MEIKVIKIGSSKGIRIPSKVLKDFGSPEEFKLNITDYGIFLKPVKQSPRAGWKDAYFKSNSCLLDV